MPENLPAVAPNTQSEPLRLVRYEAAIHAIQECARVDECKTWSDKAAALAAYAKQAQDSTLHNLALRIQQRAQRRMGELLQQLPSARGANLTAAGREGAHPISRQSVATDAGLSEHQRKTALRIASVPEEDFEALIESDQPPTVTEMAMRGTATRPVVSEPEIIPAAPGAAQAVIAALSRMASVCGAYDPASIAVACRDPDIARGYVETIDSWLDRFVTRLPPSADEAA